MKIFKKIMASLLLISMLVIYMPKNTYASNIKYFGEFEEREGFNYKYISGIIVKYLYTSKNASEVKSHRINNSEYIKDSNSIMYYGTCKYIKNTGTKIDSKGNKKTYYSEETLNFSYIVRLGKSAENMMNPSKTNPNRTPEDEGTTKNHTNDSETKNYYDDIYEEWNNTPEQAEPTPITVSATKIIKNQKINGVYEFTITFDNTDYPLEIQEAPTVKVKIGDEIRTLSFDNATSRNTLTYKTKIEDVKLGGKAVTLESISGGKVNLKQPNTITTMDYTTKLTDKSIGTIGKFIFVDYGSRGDVNSDGRLDQLDVEGLQSSKDKTMADLNGDNKINMDDKNALIKAIDNQDTIYIQFITVGNTKQQKGDVCKNNGTAGYDGIINYKDYEYISNAVAKGMTSLTYGDVDGDGKVTVNDASNIAKALKTGNEMYIHSIKVTGSMIGDINGDKVINSKDIFKLAEKPNNGDINSDGEVDARDQAALMSALMSEDISSLVYITVPDGAKGDIDGNGLINMADSKRLAACIANKNIDSQVDINIADVNGDGKVNVRDSAFISNGLSNIGNLDNEAYVKLMSYGFSLIPNNNKGDINDDSVVNIIDAQLIAKGLAKGEKTDNMDYNEDGKVSVRDAAAIAKALQEKVLEDEDPVEEIITETIQNETMYGDVDLNGEIGIADVILLSKYNVSQAIFPLNEKQLANADVNKDDFVDSVDLNVLIEYNLGTIYTLPVVKE